MTRFDVRQYRSMRTVTGGWRGFVRSIPVLPGWYVEVSDGGDVTAYGPYASAEAAAGDMHAMIAACPGPSCVVTVR